MNVIIESPAIDYHVTLAQKILHTCLQLPELQNEVYCQLIRQTSRHPAQHKSGVPVSILLYLALESHLDIRKRTGKIDAKLSSDSIVLSSTVRCRTQRQQWSYGPRPVDTQNGLGPVKKRPQLVLQGL